MRAFLRLLSDQRGLWRIWLVLLPLTLVMPLLGVVSPLIERRLIDDVVIARRLEILLPTVALYCAAWLLNAAAGISAGSVLIYLGERISLTIRRRLFAHSAALSLVFSNREHSGRTLSLFANDVPAVTGLAGQTVTQAVGSFVTVVAAATVMFSLSWQLALAGAVAPPLLAGLGWFLARPLRPAARRIQEKLAEITERIQENLTGTREVLAFGRERAEQARFAVTLQELLRLRMRLTFMQSAMQAGGSMFSLAVTVVVLGYGAWLVITGVTTLGTVVAIRSLSGLLFMPALKLFSVVGEAQRSLAALDRVYAFLDETPSVREIGSARKPIAVKGEVTFRNVDFAYQPGRPVLHDVSFAVRRGERIALVGPSGAGKSTVASLVARFYDPTGGAVLLDGVDLRELTLSGLREQIGIVFQNTFLFARTVRENIAFGREGASEQEVISAARAANAWEFIIDLPQGLDTKVGERGVLLSEGQRQRLAIARALLRNPRILILDEPTSALDARSERLLRDALANLMRDRTTFLIAHRLGTVVGADRILVLDAGRVVQHGPHAELIGQGGMYRELFNLQFPDLGGLNLQEAPPPHAVSA